MARKIVHYDTQGVICTRERVDEILAAAGEDEGPYTVAHYEGRTVQAVVRVQDTLINDPRIVPLEHWKPVTVTVSNVMRTTVEGEPLDPPVVTPDPTATKQFRNTADAMAHYETFLVQWTECERAADGSFIERGNLLNPDKGLPTVVEGAENESLFGSW